MTVYVDEIRMWPTTIRCFREGSCHLMADTLDELHAFACQLGLRRGWYQETTAAHYDLTPARRAKAITLGAVFVPAKEQLLRRHAAIVEARIAGATEAAVGERFGVRREYVRYVFERWRARQQAAAEATVLPSPASRNEEKKTS